jgi:hypothetical protein
LQRGRGGAQQQERHDGERGQRHRGLDHEQPPHGTLGFLLAGAVSDLGPVGQRLPHHQQGASLRGIRTGGGIRGRTARVQRPGPDVGRDALEGEAERDLLALAGGPGLAHHARGGGKPMPQITVEAGPVEQRDHCHDSDKDHGE